MLQILLNFMSSKKSIPQSSIDIMQHFFNNGYTNPKSVAGIIGFARREGYLQIASTTYTQNHKKLNYFI